jgi:hypothetical protein
MQDPYFATCLQESVRTLWGLDGTVGHDCGGDCTSAGSFFLDFAKHVAKGYSNAGMGLAESTDDSTVIPGWNADACDDAAALTGATFTAGLLDIRAQLGPQSNFGEFLFAGSDHTTIQSSVFYTRRSGSQAEAGQLDGGEGILMTDWVAGLLAGTPTNTGPGCMPKTCDDFPPGTCGAQDDSCGGLTAVCAASDAGLCPPGQYCGAVTPGMCGTNGSTGCVGVEVPLQCAFDYAPGTCGQQSDGLGGLTDCGPCPAPLICGSGGACTWPPDAGPCVALTCQSAGYDCGEITDGCGHVLDCGTCPVSQFCGGRGPHRCGGTCSPATFSPCFQVGQCSSDAGSCLETVGCGALDGCGLVQGTCGGLIDCGPCPRDAGAPDALGE